ncbi:MAG: cyclic lactone autoinducer peptide [Clostridia bacterium]|nr:cyclic lactone autoinducer peptide [Clostridia bacterium]
MLLCIATVAVLVAKASAVSACMFITYQPKMPKSLQK